MLPTLNVGPLAIQVPGLLYLAGVWVLVSLTEREASRNRIRPSVISNMILVGLVAGVIGARMAYALRFFEIYIDHPLSLFSLNPTTLAPTGGALIGLLAAAFYGYRQGLPLWPTLDSLTPGLAAFAIAVGFAHLASGDAFGAPTDVPWAIDLWGAGRHPSQVYEIIGSVLVFALIWRLRAQELAAGVLFLAFVGLTAAARLFLEAFRGDSVIVLEAIRRAQLLSLLLLGGILVALPMRSASAGQ